MPPVEGYGGQIDWWSALAIVSAAVSLLLLILFWHIYLIVGVGLDVVILFTLIFTAWTPE